MKSLSLLIAATASLVLSVHNPFAASHATMSGAVLDRAHNDQLAGANILLQCNGKSIRTTADSNDTFEVNDLVAGIYSLRASFTGHETYSNDSVVVKGNTRLSIDLAADVKELPEVVITGAKVIELPEIVIVGRKVIELPEIVITAPKKTARLLAEK